MKWASLVLMTQKLLYCGPWITGSGKGMCSLQMWNEGRVETARLAEASYAVLWPYSVPEIGPSAPRLHLNYLERKGLQGL